MSIKKGGADTNNSIYIIIIFILLLIIGIGILFYFTNMPKIIQNVSVKNEQPQLDDFYNVHSPPVRNNPNIFSNTNTQKLNEFTQIGILKHPDNGENKSNILPLFGRKISRDNWQYYALSNTGTIPGIKLNLKNAKGRDLMDDIGSQELYDNDIVIVDGYDKNMIVSLYKQKQFYYI
jgi:Fe-S cluster biosynthesis and repair protein YggX